MAEAPAQHTATSSTRVANHLIASNESASETPPSPPAKTGEIGLSAPQTPRPTEAAPTASRIADLARPEVAAAVAVQPKSDVSAKTPAQPLGKTDDALILSDQAAPAPTIPAARLAMPALQAPAPVLPASKPGEGNGSASSPQSTVGAAPIPTQPSAAPTGRAQPPQPTEPSSLPTAATAASPLASSDQAVVTGSSHTDGLATALPAAPATQTTTTSLAPTPATHFAGLSTATIETTARLAAQITRQLSGRSTRFEMGLTPEGLGRVDVRMDIDADGRLTAQLAFDNPLAATELRGRADELRSQLQDAGFRLTSDSLSFSQRDPSTGGDASQQQARHQNRASAANRIGSEADISPPAWISLSLKTSSGVDMKV